MKDEQKKAVESYAGAVESISVMQEVILNVKELLSNIELFQQKQALRHDFELKQSSLSLIKSQFIFRSFLNSLNDSNVRATVQKFCTESELKVLDALQTLMSVSINDWSDDSLTLNEVNSNEEISTTFSNIYDFIKGNPVVISVADDMNEHGKEVFTYRDAYNLCVKLLKNPLVRDSLKNVFYPTTETQDFFKDDDIVSKSGDICETTQLTGDFVHVESPCVQVIDEPAVDSLIKPLTNTFNFLQVSVL